MNTKKPDPLKPWNHRVPKIEDDEVWNLPDDEADHRHIGLWMIVLAWLMIILIFAFLFNSWLDKQSNLKWVEQKITTEQGIYQTEIKRTGQNQYLGKGTINHHPVVFLLDTGATDVVLPEKLARKLKLKPNATTYAHTAGGKVKVSLTRINELTIGHITIKNLRATINPAMKGDYVLLGMSALKYVNFTQRGDTLTLHTEP